MRKHGVLKGGGMKVLMGFRRLRIMRNGVFSRGNVFVQFKSRILDGDRRPDFASRKMDLGMTHADKPGILQFS